MIELYNPQALKISIGDPTSVERTFARIEGVLGEANVLLDNVGAWNVRRRRNDHAGSVRASVAR